MKNQFSHFRIHCIGAGALTAAVACGYLWGVAPALSAHQRLREAAHENWRVQHEHQDLCDRRDQLRAVVRSTRQRVDAVYPVKVCQGQSLIERTSLLLAAHSIELVNLREVVNKQEKTVVLALQIQGAYEHIVRLIGDLRACERPNQIRLFNLKSPNAETGKCHASLEVCFFEAIQAPAVNSLAHR